MPNVRFPNAYMAVACGSRQQMFKLLMVAVLFLIALAAACCGGGPTPGVASESVSVSVSGPNDEAHLQAGTTLAGEGLLEEALFEYDQAILLDLRNATVYSNRGLAFPNLGKY